MFMSHQSSNTSFYNNKPLKSVLEDHYSFQRLTCSSSNSNTFMTEVGIWEQSTFYEKEKEIHMQWEMDCQGMWVSMLLFQIFILE